MSGDPRTAHSAGVTVRDWAISETRVKEEAFQLYIVDARIGGRAAV